MINIPNLSNNQTASQESQPEKNEQKKKVRHKKLQVFLLIILGLFLIVAIISLILFYTIIIPGKRMYARINLIRNETVTLQQAVSNKDLNQATLEISKIKNQIKTLETEYKSLSFTKNFPFIKNYYKDGQNLIDIAKESLDTSEIIIKAVEPYKDFLGLKGGSTNGAKTTEDRINFLTQSIEGLLPYMDTIETKIGNIEMYLNKIDINRYPEKYNNIEIRSTFTKTRELISEVKTFIKNSRPILSKTSWLLGKDSPRSYLVIFQNDGELRPSGGFWTAYSTITVRNGKVTPGTASNIYDLDDKLASTIPAPRIIKSYHINVPYLNLRDNNLSPDFPTDAKIFLDQYVKAMGGKDKFDAVVAIDTNVLLDIVKVLGKLDTRVGTFTTNPDKRCDGCPAIIYDLEWIAGRPRNYIEKNRKDFMNPLMSALLANAMGSEKTKMPLLVEAFFKNLNQKHIMFYFPDPQMQTIAESANITGHIVNVDKNIDYIHLNDANFASAKSNIFITQKIKHDINIKNGAAEHKITVTYTNPAKASNCNLEKGDLCLNAPRYRDMFRFYVPVGSKLIDMKSSEVTPVQYEELGKQVFEGFFGNKYALNAQSNIKTSIQYISGAKIGSEYTLLLQKQPGTKPVGYELTINGIKQPKFDWVADKTIKIKI